MLRMVPGPRNVTLVAPISYDNGDAERPSQCVTTRERRNECSNGLDEAIRKLSRDSLLLARRPGFIFNHPPEYQVWRGLRPRLKFGAGLRPPPDSGAGLRPRRNARPQVSPGVGDLRSAVWLGRRPATTAVLMLWRVGVYFQDFGKKRSYPC